MNGDYTSPEYLVGYAPTLPPIKRATHDRRGKPRTGGHMPDICDIYMAALDALDQIDNPVPQTDAIPF